MTTQTLNRVRTPDPIDVLKEFTTDVEAAGVNFVKRDWPDLIPTYQRAKAVLRAAALEAVENCK